MPKLQKSEYWDIKPTESILFYCRDLKHFDRESEICYEKWISVVDFKSQSLTLHGF